MIRKVRTNRLGWIKKESMILILTQSRRQNKTAARVKVRGQGQKRNPEV